MVFFRNQKRREDETKRPSFSNFSEERSFSETTAMTDLGKDVLQILADCAAINAEADITVITVIARLVLRTENRAKHFAV